jgi:hypothetical protein
MRSVTGVAVTIAAISLMLLGGATTASAVELADGAFIHHYVKDGRSCASSEVMIGIHIDKYKVTCAKLNYGYRVHNRYIDKTGGTQISSNPSMHGCAPNYVIQALKRYGNDEDLTCVSLVNTAGQALQLPLGLHDGRGPNNNGTQSTIYGLTPTMHVCPHHYAMRGIHQHLNDLYCAG